MQLSGESNNLDLYSDARKWSGIPLTDTTTLPVSEFVLSANFGLDRVVSLVMRSDGNWQFDDSNNSASELLDVTTSLSSGVEKYAINATWLKIERVRVKDQNGDYQTLTPLDRKQLSDAQLNADAGDPKTYEKLGSWLYVRPKPSYSASAGLEVQFQRGASYFAFDDTTKEPGFAPQFHRLISLYGALDYCEQNDLEKRAAKIRNKIQPMEIELIEFYSARDMDQKIGLRTTTEDYGQQMGINNRDGF